MDKGRVDTPEGDDSPREAKAPLANCAECTLYDRPFVPGAGDEEADFIFIGEAPGAEEVVRKRPFVGRSGKLLRATLEQEGGGDSKLWFTNTVLCRPKGNRKPTQEEAACCSPRLQAEIEDHPDAVLVPTGAAATETILGDDMPGGITVTRGAWYQKNGRWVFPTWHPAYILRRPYDGPDFIHDISKALKGPVNPPFDIDAPPEVIVLDTPEKVEEALEPGGAYTRMAYDIESSQNHFVFDDPLILGIADTPSRGFVIPVGYPDMPDMSQEPRALEAIRNYFNRSFFWAHNAKFDRHFMRRIGVEVGPEGFDTMLGHYLLDERRGRQGLKGIMRERYNLRDYDKQLVHRYLKNRSDDWRKVPFDELAIYCIWDCCGTYLAGQDFMQELRAQGRWGVWEMMKDFSDMAFHMEELGMQVDIPYLERADDFLEEQMAQYETMMWELAGREVNPRSWKQLAEVIYDDRKLKPPNVHKLNLQRGVQKMNPRSTSKLALEHYAIKDDNDEIIGYDDEFLDALFKYRRAHKIRSSYISNLLEYADGEGRVHPFIFLHGTETGRISIRNPALQTIPRTTTDRYGALIRGGFTAAPGYRLVDCDYSQAELRVWAALTKDPFLLRIYREGGDLHTEVAEAMFGENWNKEHRMIVKKFNFAYVYGGGFTALMDSEIPQREAQEFMDRYNENITEVLPWRRGQWRALMANGFVESPFGRRRHYPIITGSNKIDAKHAAYNMPVQSSASDLTMLAARKLQQGGHRVILTIHDSVIVEVPENEAEDAAAEIKRVMEQVGDEHFPEVPWQADPDVLERWGEPPDF